MNRPRSSKRFNHPSDTSSEAHHHHLQQQGQQLQPTDQDIQYRRRQILTSPQVPNEQQQQQQQQRPRTRSTEHPRVRSQGPTTTTTTATNTSLDLSTTTKRGTIKSEAPKRHPVDDTYHKNNEILASSNGNNNHARNLSPRNEVQGHLSNDKRISEKLKKEPFNRVNLHCRLEIVDYSMLFYSILYSLL